MRASVWEQHLQIKDALPTIPIRQCRRPCRWRVGGDAGRDPGGQWRSRFKLAASRKTGTPVLYRKVNTNYRRPMGSKSSDRSDAVEFLSIVRFYNCIVPHKKKTALSDPRCTYLNPNSKISSILHQIEIYC
jgi:hypothetical protein